MATQVQITSPKCGPVVYFSPREGSGLNTSPSWSTDWWQLSSDNAQYSGAVIFGPRISEWLMAQSCSTDLGHPHWDCKLGENLTCSLNHNIVGSFTLNNISLNTQRSLCFLVQWEWSLSPDLKKKKSKIYRAIHCLSTNQASNLLSCDFFPTNVPHSSSTAWGQWWVFPGNW